MEGNLFGKYQVLFDAVKKEKEIIKNLLLEKTQIDIPLSSIQVQKKQIKLSLSSGERSLILLKGGVTFLKEKGYSVLLR